MVMTFKLVKLSKKEYYNLDKGGWADLEHRLAITKTDLRELTVEQLSVLISEEVYPSRHHFTLSDCYILAQHIYNWIENDTTVHLFDDDEFIDFCLDVDGNVRSGCSDPNEFVETGNRFEPFREKPQQYESS